MPLDFFGGSGGDGEFGREGPPGPPGKRGKQGDSNSFDVQFFQNLSWDIDFEPNYWIEGYDIETTPIFKLKNRYENGYDAVLPDTKTPLPTKGTEKATNRHTLKFDGTQLLTCPMDWNGTDKMDNLQVFIVVRYSDLCQSHKEWKAQLFGNDNGGSERFVCLKNEWLTDTLALIVAGVENNEGKTTHKDFNHQPANANPLQTRDFFVLSVHWNRAGKSACGKNKSSVYINGNRLFRFTAAKVSAKPGQFTIGGISQNADIGARLKGEIGRFLVCGPREHPMSEEAIIKVHKYLMGQWKISNITGASGLIRKPRQSESQSFYSQYFNYLDWDIDFRPNYWIEGQDVETSPKFKLINTISNRYDAICPPGLTPPTKGNGPLSQKRHTLKFDGKTLLECPMNLYGPVMINNVQLFMVVKFNDLTGSKVAGHHSVKGQLFGTQPKALGYKRFICVGNDGTNDYLTVSGVYGSHFLNLYADKFRPDANPLQTDNFFVLSVHYNAMGESGCGTNSSFLYINGKKIVTFTDGGDRDKKARHALDYFVLGRIIDYDYIHDKPYATWLNGEIGRFLVCGSRPHVMTEKAIENTHKYLMEEWGINQKKKILPGGSDFFSEYVKRFVDWDIWYEPSFWINGYDVESKNVNKEIVCVRLINKYKNFYHTNKVTDKYPKKLYYKYKQRYVLRFTGDIDGLTCDMNWNGNAYCDNVQIFIVYRRFQPKSFCAPDGFVKNTGLFGNVKMADGKGRWVEISSEDHGQRTLVIGGVAGSHGKPSQLSISKFPSDADPTKDGKFIVLSVHYNNIGEGCGDEKSYVYCNKKRIGTFTAVSSFIPRPFTLGNSDNELPFIIPLKGDIGQFLVCGARHKAMDHDSIKTTHEFLMRQWGVNK